MLFLTELKMADAEALKVCQDNNNKKLYDAYKLILLKKIYEAFVEYMKHNNLRLAED